MKDSPYLKKDRLANVLAAIQVMANYKFYKRDFAAWADQISGDKSKGDDWKTVFIEHPEFFRLDQTKTKASLAWRRSYPKRYDVDSGSIISKEKYYELDENERKRISRNPLRPEDITALVNSAINLHNRALQSKQDQRWWIKPVIAVSGMIIGLIPFIIEKIWG